MVQRLEVGELERDYVEFWPTGARAKGEFRCSDCGYGVVVTTTLPACPMCSSESWEQAPWSPFRRALS
jgi:rubrerythrin